MFSTLYNVIFPFLGEFFGKLVTWATMSLGDFFGYLEGNNSINFAYTNLFTGDVEWFGALNRGIFAVLIQPAKWFIQAVCNMAGVPSSTPLWAALLISSFVLIIVFGLVKFIIHFVDLIVWG